MYFLDVGKKQIFLPIPCEWVLYVVPVFLWFVCFGFLGKFHTSAL